MQHIWKMQRGLGYTKFLSNAQPLISLNLHSGFENLKVFMHIFLENWQTLFEAYIRIVCLTRGYFYYFDVIDKPFIFNTCSRL